MHGCFCQSLGRDIPNINKCVLLFPTFAEQCGRLGLSIGGQVMPASSASSAEAVPGKAQMWSLLRVLFLPGHVTMAGRHGYPNFMQKHLPHPDAVLKVPAVEQKNRCLR